MSAESNKYPRREFLGQCAAIPLAASLAVGGEPATIDAAPSGSSLPKVPKMSEADLAKEVESLLTLVDPQLLHRYVPLAADRNAWPLFKQAGERYVEEPQDDEFQQCLERFDIDQTAPAKARQRVLTWLKQNTECSKLTDQAIEKGGIELPRASQGAQLSLAMDEISLFRKLAQLKAVTSHAALLRGAGDEAIRHTTTIIKFASLLMRGECLVVDQLVAQAILGIGVYATLRAAMSDDVSPQQAIESVQRLARTMPTADDLKRALRVELCRWFLPAIAGFPRDPDIDQIAIRYVRAGLSPDDQDERKLTEPQRRDQERQVRLLVQILAGHKKPFDKLATVRLANNLHVGLFRELDKPWLERSRNLLDAIRNELTTWPEEVEADTWVLLDLGANPNGPRKLTRGEISRARKALAKVDNVVGKRLIEQQLSTLASTPIIEMHQARTESVRLRIALRLYEAKHGRLPERLNGLVDDKFLPEVARDPYDGKSFKYSAERRTIWSVGAEGNSDGVIPEKEDPENPFDQDFELTWRIAKV